MKKVLLVVAIVAVGAWIVIAVAGRLMSRFWAKDAVATSAARAWPGAMGTLASVAVRFPPLQANDAAVKLMTLASALPKNAAADDFVGREIARGELTIGEP